MSAEPIHFARTLDRGPFSEHFVTVVAPPELTGATAATAVTTRLTQTVAAAGIVPLQETLYGPASLRAPLLDARRAAYEHAAIELTHPCTTVAGRPGSDPGGPVAAQLWGITPRADDVLVRSVELPTGRRGRLLETDGLRLLILQGLTGKRPDGTLAYGPSDQAAQMFANAEAALQSQGFEYRHVARTWIRLRRLLHWYDELNRVRTAFHRERGITGTPDGQPLPASTGIQGRHADEECVMDLLAVQPADTRWSVAPMLRSDRQDEPRAYGSGFSRGMALGHQDTQSLLVSGTASIGPDGATRHVGDPAAQARETLLSIAALIESHGARLQDIAAGVLYCKDAEARRAYAEVAAQLELSELPLVPVWADVCRPDLLLEIEAVALTPQNATATAGPGAEERP